MEGARGWRKADSKGIVREEEANEDLRAMEKEDGEKETARGITVLRVWEKVMGMLRGRGEEERIWLPRDVFQMWEGRPQSSRMYGVQGGRSGGGG